ncbi:Alpha-1,3/1,6-mannosyltransferase [Podosphaera aphanis]|nr:Alpha-1,3/1,6-mannosyltransferase [Podosphaera aphanis]
MEPKKNKTIIFLHPDLGIGGAERLIIDTAVGLQKRGHKVVIFTSRCDAHHCFDEARNGTLDVRVRGNTIVPSSIFSRFTIMCSVLRQLHLTISTYLNSEIHDLQADAFIVDQLSAGLPLLSYLYFHAGILFYCHFPDLLLVQGRSSWWKRLYRVPFDFLEEWSMMFADYLVVNSGFTKKILIKEFPSLAKRKTAQVIYPCVDVTDKYVTDGKKIVNAWGNKKVLLSINRFEKKKNIALSIEAYARLEKSDRKGVRLVIAGGYDDQVRENVIYHKELIYLAESLGLKTVTTKTVVTALNVPDDIDVLFLLSVPNAMKEMLLASARLLIYTPSNEHFGIVPLEAMLLGVPVLAASTGGPLETVVDGKTGWLCAPEDIESWTKVINNVLHKMSDEEVREIGNCGTMRVKEEFSSEKMVDKFELALSSMAQEKLKNSQENSAAVKEKICQLISIPLLSIAIVIVDLAYYLASKSSLLGEKFENLPLRPFVITTLSLALLTLYTISGYMKEQSRRRREMRPTQF